MCRLVGDKGSFRVGRRVKHVLKGKGKPSEVDTAGLRVWRRYPPKSDDVMIVGGSLVYDITLRKTLSRRKEVKRYKYIVIITTLPSSSCR